MLNVMEGKKNLESFIVKTGKREEKPAVALAKT
jgi:hypothetical protein